MRTLILSLALATASAVATAPFLAAEDRTGRNVDTEAAGEPGGVATLSLAHELYRRGVEDGDALTVLVAARLAASVGSEPGDRTPRREGGAASSGTDAASATDGPPSAEAMFLKAGELAEGDAVLAGLIADAEAETSRGRLCCTTTFTSRLPAGAADIWEIGFRGDEFAEVLVVGDGTSNLDMLITDENGNVICYDITASDQFYCDWVPLWDGIVYVTIENVGDSLNHYLLETNS